MRKDNLRPGLKRLVGLIYSGEIIDGADDCLIMSAGEYITLVWQSLLLQSRANPQESRSCRIVVEDLNSRKRDEIRPSIAEYVLAKEEMRRASVYRTVGMFPHEIEAVCCR